VDLADLAQQKAELYNQWRMEGLNKAVEHREKKASREGHPPRFARKGTSKRLGDFQSKFLRHRTEERRVDAIRNGGFLLRRRTREGIAGVISQGPVSREFAARPKSLYYGPPCRIFLRNRTGRLFGKGKEGGEGTTET